MDANMANQQTLPTPLPAVFTQPVKAEGAANFDNVHCYVEVTKDMSVLGNLRVLGKVEITGELIVRGNVKFGKTEHVKVGTNGKDHRELPSGEILTIAQDFQGLGEQYIFNEGVRFMDEKKEVCIMGQLQVKGNVTVYGDVTMSNTVEVRGGVQAFGTTTFAEHLSNVGTDPAMGSGFR